LELTAKIPLALPAVPATRGERGLKRNFSQTKNHPDLPDALLDLPEVLSVMREASVHEQCSSEANNTAKPLIVLPVPPAIGEGSKHVRSPSKEERGSRFLTNGTTPVAAVGLPSLALLAPPRNRPPHAPDPPSAAGLGGAHEDRGNSLEGKSDD
jgi:hypothetical protein